MKQWIVAALLCSSPSACIVSVEHDTSITVLNRSDYVVMELYVARSNQTSFGEDLLGSTVLYPGDRISVEVTGCGSYDILVVDEYGDACELWDVDPCRDDGVWHLTNHTLETCH